MKYKRLLAIGLSIVMVFAFTACNNGDKKGTDDKGKDKKVSEKLEFEGEWKEEGPIKMGMPAGWVEFDVSSTDKTATIDIESDKNSNDDTLRVEAFYSAQYILGSSNRTLEDFVKSEISPAEINSEIERVELAGLTFAKVEYSYNPDDVRTMYLYISGENDNYEAIKISINLLGPYQKSDLVPKIVNSLRVDFPKEFESLKNEIVDRKPLATGGTVETEKFKVEVPDDWAVSNSDDKSAEFITQNIQDATLNIKVYDSSIFGTAAENAESTAKNFQNEYPVETKDIGNLHLTGITSDSQFYMFIDSNDGSYYAKISGMFCTLEQATPLIEKITFK